MPKKIRTAEPQQNFTGSYKKKCTWFQIAKKYIFSKNEMPMHLLRHRLSALNDYLRMAFIEWFMIDGINQDL